jgi:NitT/TauT family transport system ATP-binding protein
VGPSGVGKSTLLRCLAGLQRPTGGRVLFRGKAVDAPPEGLGVVFQDYSRSLLPWMRIVDNVALPLRAAGVGKAERRRRALEMIEELGLGHAGQQHPWQLSGGMQQRVALARSLVRDPVVLLMDEPFASVDAQTRFELEDLTLAVRARTQVSVVLVTHDIDEAVYLGDRVVVLSGSPAAVVDVIDIPLGAARSQLETRSEPLFAELRTRVLRDIQQGRVPRPGTGKPAQVGAA